MRSEGDEVFEKIGPTLFLIEIKRFVIALQFEL